MHCIEICIDCRGVITQCRCLDRNKPQRLGLCATCGRIRQETATCEASEGEPATEIPQRKDAPR